MTSAGEPRSPPCPPHRLRPSVATPRWHMLPRRSIHANSHHCPLCASELSSSHTSSLHTAPLPLRWVNGWVTLEAIVKALSDSELGALDDYQESNPSPIFKEERARLRAQETEDEDKT